MKIQLWINVFGCKKSIVTVVAKTHAKIDIETCSNAIDQNRNDLLKRTFLWQILKKAKNTDNDMNHSTH